VTVPDGLEILQPWQIISDSPNAERLNTELSAELSRSHLLYGLKANAVASRIDRDDVLFEIHGGSSPLAVVHLSWRKESDPRWPTTTLFTSWEEWVRDDLLPANKEYNS